MDTDITKTAEEYHLYDINDCIIETLTVIRRESLKLNKKLCLGIQIFSCFQVLSLIFSPKASLSLPWNYSSLEIIWIVIGLIARPYLIIDYLNISILVLMIIPICYLFMVAMYLTIFLNIKKRMNIGENITQVGTNYILIIRTESLLRYLLLDAGYLSVLMLHRYLFEWTLAEDQDYQYAICLFCLITMLYLPLIYTKGYYLMALKWNTQAYNTMSHPQPYFYYKVAYMALVYSTVAVKFESKPAEYAIIFMVCGGYLIILFAYIQPYVQFIVNFIQCIKGLALFLAGLIMFVFSISGNCNQESYTATLAFFITLPFLSYFMKELMVKRRNYVLNKQDILSNTYESFIKIQEHRSMQYSKLPENENFMTNVQTIRKAHRNNFYINIWLLYYLLDAENWGGICLFLSKIRRLTLSIQQKSFVQEFKEEYYKTVRINQEYGEAIDFLSYRKKMSALSDSDKTCCYTILRIYEHFSAQRDIHKLSQLIVIFMRVYRDTKDVYSSLLKAYPKTVELLQYYVGFLEIIENSTDKGNTITTLQELNSENKTYVRYGSNMLNACSLSLLVSLEKRNLGTVKWVYNTSLFGYYDDQLAGDSYFKLFPSSLKNYLYRIHKSRKNYFYLNDLFSKTKSLYIILNNRFLQLVSIKFRIANMEDNSICGVVSFSKNNKGVELALLSEDGRRIVHMVTTI